VLHYCLQLYVLQLLLMLITPYTKQVPCATLYTNTFFLQFHVSLLHEHQLRVKIKADKCEMKYLKKPYTDRKSHCKISNQNYDT